jgi:hypothetical protein
VHLAGGAVIGAVLLKLDAAQTEHALGLALAQAGLLSPSAAYGSEARILIAALTAPVGVQAAEFAASGIRGASDPLEGDGGLFRRLDRPPLLGAFGGLGTHWLTESLGYKIYPGSLYLATIIDCVLGLVRQHHIDPRKVYAIHVGAGPHALAMDGRSAPYIRNADSLPVTLTQTVAFPVAAALIERELSPRQFGRDRIANAAIWELAAKVRLSLDEDIARRARDRSPLRVVGDDGSSANLFDLSTCDLNAYKSTFGARVRIELEGGRSSTWSRTFRPAAARGPSTTGARRSRTSSAARPATPCAKSAWRGDRHRPSPGRCERRTGAGAGAAVLSRRRDERRKLKGRRTSFVLCLSAFVLHRFSSHFSPSRATTSSCSSLRRCALTDIAAAAWRNSGTST